MEREFILINIIGFDKPGVTSAVTEVLGKYGAFGHGSRLPEGDPQPRHSAPKTKRSTFSIQRILAPRSTNKAPLYIYARL